MFKPYNCVTKKMPELPEVETVKTGLSNNIISSKIKSIKIYQDQLRWKIDSQIKSWLNEAIIIDVRRRAKYLLIYTTKGNIIIHLGMSGSITLKNNTHGKIKHDHVEFYLENPEMNMVYNDPRRFGFIIYTNSDPLQHKLLSKLGPEPLSKYFSDEYLYNRSHISRRTIKSLIMDQKIVVGVGNIYACEALFLSQINPKTLSNKLNIGHINSIVNNVKITLNKSINEGGTTLKDFKNTKGKPGYFSQSLYVYGRKGQKCLICNHIINSVVLSQRNSFFCPNCQKDES